MLADLMNAARSLDVIQTVTKEKVAAHVESDEWDAAARALARLKELSDLARELAAVLEAEHAFLIRVGWAPEVFPGQREEFAAAFSCEADMPSPWEPVVPENAVERAVGVRS